MKCHQFLLLILSLMLTACGQSTQYDLIIKNTSSQTIQVIARSQDPKELKDRVVFVPPNQQQVIISTDNIPNRNLANPKYPCYVIAEYVGILNEKEQPSNYQWCRSDHLPSQKSNELIQTDFEQVEYIVTIDDTHFD